ncbi:MAG: AAA family ATPase [Proteobacteria bacterium]|nr:AAA family ATPase [Pseudomonadota bacterium]
MASLIPDTIDFSAYLANTDAEHKVRPASAFVDDVVAHFHSPAGQTGARMPWPKTHSQLRFRPGEVTLWGGFNGSGKSLVLGQICLGLVEQGAQVCIASLEMRPAMTLARMCRQAYGAQQPGAEFIREFHTRTRRRLWFFDQQGTVRTDKMLAVIRYCADKIKVDHFVIDSLMKCGVDEDDYNSQKRFLDALCVTARDNNLHIHLVAHSRKGRDEFAPPGKMDVKGSGAITDQVDNVVTVWRNKSKEREITEGKNDRTRDPDALLICDKQRNGDWEGKIALWFHPASTQYIENGIAEPIPLLSQIDPETGTRAGQTSQTAILK